MKIFLISLLVLISSFLNCFWDEIISWTWELSQNDCLQNKYEIIWDFDSKLNNNLNFSIKNNINELNKIKIGVEYIIKKEWLDEIKKSWEKIALSLWEVWIYDIKSKIVEEGTNCEYTLTWKINVYSKIISFISDNNSLNLSFDDDFKKNNLYFNKIYLDNKNTTSIQDSFLSSVTDKLYLFQDSDIIIIDSSSSYLQILQWFEKLSSLYNINFLNKKIFIVTDSSFILSKKILSNFINSLNLSIYTFTPNNLLNFLNYISTWKSSSDIIKNKNYNINQISLDNKSNYFLFLTNFTNKLISSGFPISILWIVFSLWVAVTFINFIRQFVGISIFNLYYPLFFALSIYLFSLEISLILFLSSILSMYFMKIIYKKVHFLLNTKLSLFFIFYLIIAIIFIWILNIFNLVDFTPLKSNLVVFPFAIIPMIAYKIFADERKIWSIWFVFYLFEFIFVCLTAYFVIKSNFIQNLFLAYTELLILVFIINFMIWKFTWLQLVEYIRFIPLIKRHYQEEE